LVHLKKVEIYGFKSFGFTNTIVQFEPGLVSISGPNGSGKSNILDAIQFALGENKPKTLRVDKLRSLIHDIDGNRRGAKLTRSSVHFDNSDRKIPVDSDIVVITREMNEQGESIYYLNKKKITRSQVLDLLDMANAGLGQLNAIQQGTVTRISEFTSEEKRETIEDLIGLSYFDEKKTASLKELEAADRRFEVATATMDEVKKRIDELEEERNQQLRHDFLERELNRYKAIAATNEMKSILSQKTSKESTLHTMTTEITEFDGQKTVLKAEIDVLESEKSKLMTEADNFNQEKALFDAEMSSAFEQYEAVNSIISVSTKRIEQIDNTSPKIKTELEDIQNSISDINAQILKIKESIEETNLKKNKINNDVVIVDSEYEKILTEQSDIAAKKSEIDNKIQILTSQLNDVKLKLSKAQQEKEHSKDKIKRNSRKFDELVQGIVNLSASKSKFESMIQCEIR